jgi:hypothetical protein
MHKRLTTSLRSGALLVILALSAPAQPPAPRQADIQTLLDRLSAAEARIKELEQRQGVGMPSAPASATPAAMPPATASSFMPAAAPAHEVETATPVPTPSLDDDPHAHMMEIPGGPEL